MNFRPLALISLLALPVRADAPADTTVSIGATATCAVRGGSAFCWGEGGGKLGNGDRKKRLTATPLSDPAGWKQVSIGMYQTCGVKNDGALFCWGEDDLKEHQEKSRLSPLRVGTATFLSVSVGQMHICAIKSDGTLWCWGMAQYGELGAGIENRKRTELVQAGKDSDWASVALGSGFTCAIKRDGSLWGFGLNTQGQLGVGGLENKGAPTRVGTEVGWKQVSGGVLHACATKVDGTAYCWGFNQSGEVGLKETQPNKPVPTPQKLAGQWAEVAAGNSHSCGLQKDGSLWCWGRFYGAPKIPDFGEKPVRIDKDGTFSHVASGAEQICVSKASGEILCFGDNGFGLLGTGDSDAKESLTPVRF